MEVLLVVASGVALALTVSVPRAVGRPPAQDPAPRPARSIADTGGLRLPLPQRWHRVVVYGGIGSNSFGIGELVVANFPISRTAVECDHVLPQLTPHEVLLRVYDYGPGTEAGAWRAGGLRLGRALPWAASWSWTASSARASRRRRSSVESTGCFTAPLRPDVLQILF